MGISLWKTGIKDLEESAQGERQVTEESGSNEFFVFPSHTTLPLPVSLPASRKRVGDVYLFACQDSIFQVEWTQRLFRD